MEFEMKFKLNCCVNGHEITVTADAAGNDCLISLTLPHSFGMELEHILTTAWIQREEIEEAAWQDYQGRLREIRESKT